MQSMNENNEVVQTDILEDIKKFEDVGHKIMLSRRKGAVKHVIGELPPKGSIINLYGLRLEVKFVDYKRGELRLKLLGEINK